MENEQIRFFDAFTDLDLESRLYHIFSEVSVLRVTASNSQRMARIELNSKDIISHKDIKRVEEALHDQIFRKTNYLPQVRVRFLVDGSKSAGDIFQMYREVLVEEIRAKHPIDYYTFCREQMEFTDENTLQITCPDEPVAHNRSHHMQVYLETCMKERFDRTIRVVFNYVEPKKNTRAKADYEYYVMDDREVDKTRSYREDVRTPGEDGYADSMEALAAAEAAEAAEREAEGYAAAAESSAGAEQKTSDESAKKDKETTTKKQDNKKKKKRRGAPEPGLVYGRNVDGDITPIEDIFDGIGVVVIAGMVNAVEIRETRKEGLCILMFDVTDFHDTIRCKMFVDKDEYEEYSLGSFIDKGHFLCVKGKATFDDKFDREVRIMNIEGIK
ncbi:MAG: PolC-type DNA polymerase III N-terminal domain-containing protein, partial [Eubacterium sp.]|nr:PolC-type DNA polymerase III N-terminal domain-containing protein [Eubacterium sp.]